MSGEMETDGLDDTDLRTLPSETAPIATQLPARGDRLAEYGWQVGMIAYVALVLALLGGSALKGGTDALLQFVGRSSTGWNPMVLFVVALSMLITVVMLTRARADIAFLKREERDIEWMDCNGAARQMWILLPFEQRAAAMSRGEEPAPETWRATTLLSERVRRVSLAMRRADGARPATEQLRFIAESRTGAYGQNVRYAATLLLLLTVLGTFSGVKTALPALIDAVKNSGNGALTEITAPLSAVAEAFGSNSFALIGAIALGIVAQGYSAGRLLFLERLELVSEDVLYASGSEATAQPLVAATRSLEKAAQRLLESQSAFEDIGAAIDRLDTTTSDSFSGLQGAMAELGSKNDEEFFRHSARLFESVELRLGRLEDSLAATASIYGSLVADLNRRTVETKEAAEALAGANTSLADGLSRHADVAEVLSDASSNVKSAAADIQSTVQSLHATVEAMRAETASLREDLRHPRESVAAELEKPLDRLTTAVDAMKAAAQGDRSVEALRQLQDGIKRLTAAVDAQGNRDAVRSVPKPDSIAAPADGLGTKAIVEELRRMQTALGSERKRDNRRMAIDVALWSVTLSAALALYLYYGR